MTLTKREAVEITLVGYLPAVLLGFFGRLPSSVANFYVAHPWELIFATYSLPMLGLLYLHPRSPLRLALIPIITLGVFCYRSTCLRFMPNKTIASVPEGPFYLLYLLSIDTLLVRRLYLGTGGKEKSEVLLRHKNTSSSNGTAKSKRSAKSKGTAQDRSGITSWTAIGWVNRVIWSYRAIGSPRQAPNIPRFYNKDPNYTPSRAVFLLKRGLVVVAAFLFIDFLNHQPKQDPNVVSVSNALLFPPEVSPEAIGTRVFITLFFWFFMRIMIGLIYNMISWIGVATFLTTPADWPPYFGSPLDAFTLRKFWSVFWHTALRNPLVSPANFLAYELLRFPRGSLLGRYISIYSTFAVSATIHTLVDDTAGIPRSVNTAYKLFLMQAIGITIEDFVEWVYRSNASKTKTKNGKSSVDTPRLWHKLVGYIWVIGWLSWTTPAWAYQNLRNEAEPLFPFSAVEYFERLER